MKTKLLFLFQKIIKEIRLEQLFHEQWISALRRSKDFKKWWLNMFLFIMMTGIRYKTSIHEILKASKDSQMLYRSLKNPYYNFSMILKEIGYTELKTTLEERSDKSKSWKSKHKIYIDIDESLYDRTTDGFEEIKYLPSHEHCHVVINILLVINDKRYHVPINQRICPANRTGESKIILGIAMIEELLYRAKNEGYDLNDICVLADRAYLCEAMYKMCLKYGMTFTCKLKRNTILIDELGNITNVEVWINQEWNNNLKGFKSSIQLSDWCRKHKAPDVCYKSKTFQTNFMGKVKVVMAIDEDAKKQDDVKVYVSTNLNKSAVMIIREYREIRWIIEIFHRSVKQDIEVEKSYQGRKFIGITNHNVLKCITYLILMKWKKEHRKSTWSIGQVKRFLEENYLRSLNPGQTNVFMKKSKTGKQKRLSGIKKAA